MNIYYLFIYFFLTFVGHLKFSLQKGGLTFKGGGKETLEVLCRVLSRVARTMFVFWGNIFGEATNKVFYLFFLFFILSPFPLSPVAEGHTVPFTTLCIVLDGC